MIPLFAKVLYQKPMERSDSNSKCTSIGVQEGLRKVKEMSTQADVPQIISQFNTNKEAKTFELSLDEELGSSTIDHLLGPFFIEQLELLRLLSIFLGASLIVGWPISIGVMFYESIRYKFTSILRRLCQALLIVSILLVAFIQNGSLLSEIILWNWQVLGMLCLLIKIGHLGMTFFRPGKPFYELNSVLSVGLFFWSSLRITTISPWIGVPLSYLIQSFTDGTGIVVILGLTFVRLVFLGYCIGGGVIVINLLLKRTATVIINLSSNQLEEKLKNLGEIDSLIKRFRDEGYNAQLKVDHNIGKFSYTVKAIITKSLTVA